MRCCVCLWVVLAAGAITVSGIHKSVLDTIRTWPTACQPPELLEDSNLQHVECQGLATLQDVKRLLNKESWPQLGSLTIANSNLTTNLTVDDLVGFPALHTLNFRKSRLQEWREAVMPSAPMVRKLVVEQCWDNDTYLAKNTQLTLTLGLQFQDALPDLEELLLIDIYLPHIAKLTGLKKLKRFVIDEGAALCSPENLWLLEWHDAGKVEMNSTICFVVEKTEEGLESMSIIFSFVQRNFIEVLRFVKSATDDCPVPCHCEIAGFQRNFTPITIVNCTSANWTELPDLIPSHTSSLILNNNRISNISKVFVNPKYRSVSKIALMNNVIDHIDGELLCKYLENHSLDFSINLINNRLETLPVKHLERMYDNYAREGHRVLPTFNLGGNPWNCDDCAFLVPFQYLIFYQDLQTVSARDIRCGEGRYSEGQPIIMLPVRRYCKVEHLEPLDILNICLGILLLLFIINFLHNLVQYQRHGKLPWIVTKFPCC